MSVRWIHAAIDVAAADQSASVPFWESALGWPLGEPWTGHPEFTMFRPPDGGPYVLLQTIGDGEPRVHLDIAVDDVARTVSEMAALGAEVGAATGHWQVMTSPGGMPFCLVGHGEAPIPAATVWDDGHRSRLVQLCVDSPADLHDAEVAFWRASVDWDWWPSTGEEFAGKLANARTSPLQLLFQRLDEGSPATTVRAHADLGSDDVEAEASRLEALGARRVFAGRGWIALDDPAGMTFCVTGNVP